MSDCRDCKSEINDGAIKCHSCGSYQNRMRFIHNGTILFGFLVVVFTFFSIPTINEIFFGSRASLEVNILNAGTEKVSLIVSNTGNRPAGIRNLSITEYSGEGKSWKRTLDFDVVRDPVIEAGHVRVFEVEHKSMIAEVGEPGEMMPNKRLDCGVWVEYFQLDGWVEITGNKFKCHIMRRQGLSHNKSIQLNANASAD